MIDKTDPIGNRQGAPGLFIDAQFGAYLDNFVADAESITHACAFITRPRLAGRLSSLLVAACCWLASHCSRVGSRHRRLADVGRHARPQHGLEHEGPADRVGRQDEEEHQVGGRARLAELRQPGRRRRHGVRRHQQRAAARPEAGRRSRRADGVPRVGRRVPVAADARRSSSPAAPTTGRSRASPRRRWSRASGSTTSATAASCSASTSRASATTRTTARSRTRS